VIDHTKLDTEAKIAAVTETVSLRARHLEGAVLIGAVLRKADFAGAYLQGADLTTADLRNANFACTGLANSPSGLSVRIGDNVCTQLQGAKLKGAQLQGAALSVAQLQGADLAGAVLDGALQNITELQGTNLSASLKGANLDGAELQGASLRNVFVWRADARSANAKGARIDMVVSEPKQYCGNRNGPIGCDWSDVWWSDFKKRTEHEVPEGVLRAAVLKGPKTGPRKAVQGRSGNGPDLGRTSELVLNPLRL
jgi:hypothetical protein